MTTDYKNLVEQAIEAARGLEYHEEKFDVLDENGTPINVILPRTIVHKFGLWHRAIAGWIINDNNEVLIQKRSMKKEKNAGLWDLSFAGHVPTGQYSVSAAAREINEDVAINIGRRVYVKDFSFITSFRHENSEGNIIERQFYELFTLFTKITNAKNIDFENDEVSELRFVDLRTLNKMRNEKDSAGKPIFVRRPDVVFDSLNDSVFNIV